MCDLNYYHQTNICCTYKVTIINYKLIESICLFSSVLTRQYELRKNMSGFIDKWQLLYKHIDSLMKQQVSNCSFGVYTAILSLIITSFRLGYCYCQGIRGLGIIPLTPQPLRAYCEISGDIKVRFRKKLKKDVITYVLF